MTSLNDSDYELVRVPRKIVPDEQKALTVSTSTTNHVRNYTLPTPTSRTSRKPVAVAATKTTKFGKNKASGLTVPSVLTNEMRSSMRGLMNPNEIYKFRLAQTSSVTSTAGGLFNQTNVIVPLDPSGATEWANIAALFDEFRVITIGLEWQPFNRYTNSTGVATKDSFAWAVGLDNDSTPTATTYDQVLTYPTSHFTYTGDPWKFTFHRPLVTKAAYWTDTSAPSGSVGGVISFADTLTPSTLYGEIYRIYFVECRMRA